MRSLEAGSMQTCITSPPYFGLRDYDVPPSDWPEVTYSMFGSTVQIPPMRCELGMEPTPEAFVGHLVLIFREVRRLLRDDGTLWLNLGDSYASKPNGSIGATGLQAGLIPHVSVRQAHARRSSRIPEGLKHKDLMGIPWRVAFALQADGWHLRQDIIWSKPNPMPEPVKDRCAKAHEYLFLLAKSKNYHFDYEAIKEPAAASSVARWAQNVDSQAGSDRVPGKTNGRMKAVGGRRRRDSFERNGAVASHVIPGQRAAQHRADREASTFDIETRNKRSVWTVPTTPFKEAHFATFPERLIEPCVLAGAPAGGVVFDPFLGAGTTAVVAERLGRRWVGCELSLKYVAIAKARIHAVQPGLSLGDVA